MTRIAVALCTHNGARWLEQQLESISAQSQPPYELVVSDDASTDDTVAIVREFASSAAFPVHITRNERALGVGINFGSAMARCTGDWIAFADQDDIWHREKLEMLTRAAEHDPSADLLFSDARCVDANGNPLGYSLWESLGFTGERRVAFDEEDALDVLLWRNVVTGAAAMVRASRRTLLLPIGEGWIHDGWSAALLASFGHVIAVPAPLFDYRQHANNQIGARPLSIDDRLVHARMTPRDDYRRQLEALGHLRERLLLVRDCLAPSERDRVDAAIPKIDAKLGHLAVRSGLPDLRLLRVAPVLREMTSGRYSRFASGALSAARDLMLR
jgi:glycosyltransferase involved in cell wall biosynthesis